MVFSSSVQFFRNRFTRAVLPVVAIGVASAFSPGVQGQCIINEVQRVINPDAIIGSDFGWSVAVDGPVMVIGAPIGDFEVTFLNGAAYIYRLDGATTTWILERSITAPESQPFDADLFGWSVSVSGNDVTVGAPTARNSFGQPTGEVYVFHYNAATATWNDGRLLLTDQGEVQGGDRLGDSVAISGDIIVAGAPKDKIGALPSVGSAYIFDRNAGGLNNWG